MPVNGCQPFRSLLAPGHGGEQHLEQVLADVVSRQQDEPVGPRVIAQGGRAQPAADDEVAAHPGDEFEDPGQGKPDAARQQVSRLLRGPARPERRSG